MIQRGNQAPHAQADDQPAQDYRSRCRHVGQITVDAKDSRANRRAHDQSRQFILADFV